MSSILVLDDVADAGNLIKRILEKKDMTSLFLQKKKML